MKMMLKSLLVFVLLSALTVVGSAQGGPPGRGKPSWEPRPGGPPPDQRGDRRGPPDWGRGPGGDFRGPMFEMFSDNKVVKGAPYSATAVTETVQTLADGAKITHKKSDNVYRDSEGRTRREQTFDRVGPFSVGDQPRQIVFINDPVAGISYFLDPQRKTARRMSIADRPTPSFTRPAPPMTDERKTEALSKQLFDEVEAEGTRVTTTIPAGKIGNDRALEIVSERWESPVLQVVVLSKHKDPFAGETTYRLTDIKRQEPAHTLFEVPADYTIEEVKGGRPQGPPSGRGAGFAPGSENRRKPPHEQ